MAAARSKKYCAIRAVMAESLHTNDSEPSILDLEL
jgi:hypothetical protein